MKNPFKWLISLFRSNREEILLAIEIAENIKKVLNSKTANFLLAMIPGRFPNKLRYTLLRITAEVLHYLHLAKTINALPDTLKSIRAMDKAEQNKTYEAIAGEIVSRRTGLDIEAAKNLVTTYYEAEFKPNRDA